MDCFLRALRTLTNLLIALLLFAAGSHFVYAAQTEMDSPVIQQTPQKQITIIAQHFSSYYSTIAKSLSLSSLSNDYRIVNMSLEDWKSQRPQSELVISLGPSPLEELLKSEHQEPVLAGLITYQDWKKAVNQYPAMDTVSAIFYDPDPNRQIVLGKLLLPLSESVGVMYSTDTPYFLQGYEQALKAMELNLQAIKIKQTSEVARRFPALSQESDFIIAQPDPIIYNSQTLPRVLLSSYRQRKVIIGYSTGVVNAGAVATTFTTPEMLVDDLKESAAKFLEQGFQSFARYCKYYDIKYNTEVARSLELDMISKEQLQSELDKLKLETDDPAYNQSNPKTNKPERQ
ncbi:MAG: hypothetical protein HUJ19_07215 [Kangiella sp.]|nr:hypothetical protein [Kangiella sp.]